MVEKNKDLHGNAPDDAEIALLIIDVINALDFENGAQLLKNALPAAHNTARLKRRVKRAGAPVIYVNDNFGKWQSDFRKLIAHCSEEGVCGKPLVEILHPDEDDYFVLRPKHSGFFSTTLDTLLKYLGAKTLILTGLTGDICVLFTANDAYMRDFSLIAPSDCVASADEEENRRALEHMRRTLKADTRPSDEIRIPPQRKSRAE